MLWPALWPSGTDFRAACTMFSAQPKAQASRQSPVPASVCEAASAKATGLAPPWLRSHSTSERPICSHCACNPLVPSVCMTQSLSCLIRSGSSLRRGQVPLV